MIFFENGWVLGDLQWRNQCEIFSNGMGIHPQKEYNSKALRVWLKKARLNDNTDSNEKLNAFIPFYV